MNKSRVLNLVVVVLSLLGVVSMLIGCNDGIVSTEGQDKESTAKTDKKNIPFFKKSLALISTIEKQTDLLLPLARKMPPPKSNEWRSFWPETEQSPQQYVLDMPSLVTPRLNTLYVKPLGFFTVEDYQILDKIVEFLGINFQTRVVVLDKEITELPPEAKRTNEYGEEQLSSVYITDVLLKEEMPEDAWGVLAVTPNDIFRADGIDKLYGDTLRYGRRGVISLYRLKENGSTSLLLSLKGASHEATHLLSVPHCVKYRCNMNGRITLEEFREAPLHYCPDCLCKLLFATGADINKRFTELMEFCKENDLGEELDYYSRAYSIINDQTLYQKPE